MSLKLACYDFLELSARFMRREGRRRKEQPDGSMTWVGERIWSRFISPLFFELIAFGLSVISLPPPLPFFGAERVGGKL